MCPYRGCVQGILQYAKKEKVKIVSTATVVCHLVIILVIGVYESTSHQVKSHHSSMNEHLFRTSPRYSTVAAVHLFIVF